MNHSHGQRGITFIGMLILLAIIAAGLTVGARLLPLYLESYQVDAALDDLANDRRMSESSRGELREALFRQFSIDNVDSVQRQNVTFDEVSGGMEILVEYERRVHMIGNLDAVATFRKDALVPN